MTPKKVSILLRKYQVNMASNDDGQTYESARDSNQLEPVKKTLLTSASCSRNFAHVHVTISHDTANNLAKTGKTRMLAQQDVCLPIRTITMSNYRYIIQTAEKQLLINIDRQVARLLGHVGHLHVPRWGA
jgi:hypothetical protein